MFGAEHFGLTITGYGNLVPGWGEGQILWRFREMLTGQFFLVALVAGLVSLWPQAPARTKTPGQTTSSLA